MTFATAHADAVRRRPLSRPIVWAAWVAVGVSSLMASTASAQYRVDNSQARDANNRVGSGGFNNGVGQGAIQQRVGGTAGNYIVTGNVTGGRAFRGSLGYTDPSAFRGSLGSASFDTFYRDSVGFGTARGAQTQNFATIQPYFGSGQTVAPPTGFVADPSRGGGFIATPRTLVQSNDTRLDFGGATRAEVNQGVISSQRVVGGAGLVNGPADLNTPAIAPFDISAPPQTQFQISDYTSLARARPSLLNATPQGADALSSEAGLNRIRTIQQNDPSQIGVDGFPTGGNVINPNARGEAIDSGRAITPLDGRLEATARPLDPNAPAAGRSAANGDDRSTGILSNNPQYAELRRRLEATDRTRRLPGSDAVERVNQQNRRVLAERNGTSAQPNDDRNADPAARPGGNNAGNGNRSGGQNDATGTLPRSALPDQPVDQTQEPERLSNRVDSIVPNSSIDPRRPGERPTVVSPSGTTPPVRAAGDRLEQPTVPADNLNLPRPESDRPALPATRPAAMGEDGAPMKISSLATGVKDPALAEALTRAEASMKQGKFATAIDTYERAGGMAKGDPIVFMGRSIAELGGSYYRRAEGHLRDAYAAERALLMAKFDLRVLLGDERLNFLVSDLNDIARTNTKDPGPLLLLAFIYYNGGLEDRAARALTMAQTRAGGNDATVTLLQQAWQLPANAGGDESK